jgi:hypothetical protein
MIAMINLIIEDDCDDRNITNTNSDKNDIKIS